MNILVAGIGGASLGVEIVKSLRLAGSYRVLGCDISPLAFGHYSGLCDRTYRVSPDSYIEGVLDIVDREGIEIVIPGAEEPMKLIAQAQNLFAERTVLVAANSPAVVNGLSDKGRSFRQLQIAGIRVPRTVILSRADDLHDMSMPCIVKPATESGGSSFVFFARDEKEAALYAAYLINNGKRPIAQEYLTHRYGEFSVGVLSDSAGKIQGVIALKRSFPGKLSVLARGADFLISSGFSQGYIDTYSDVCDTACKIAAAVGSVGPLNIQGRLAEDGNFLPFEINPRFSASTYLRALAGFNEVDYFVRHLMGRSDMAPLTVRPGWYLRGLTEQFVPATKVLS